jgi:phosphoglycolate phosphatase
MLFLIPLQKSGPTMKDATVIFDLDGTMVDTAPDLIAAANHVLGRFGMAPVEARIVQPAVGLGAKAMILAAMTERGRPPDAETLDLMTRQFIEFYSDNIAVGSRIFPGLAEALALLRNEGARLGVCTNKREALALKLLAELGLDHAFDAIAGADTFSVRKPDAGHLLGTIAMAGGDPARAAMIGDTSIDAAAARNARLPFVAVSFGYGDRPAEALQPDAVIHSFADLLPVLRRLFAGQNRVPGRAAGPV